MSPESVHRPTELSKIKIGADAHDIRILNIQAKLENLDFEGALELAQEQSPEVGIADFTEAGRRVFKYLRHDLSGASPEDVKLFLELDEFCVKNQIIIDSSDRRDLLAFHLGPRLSAKLVVDHEAALQLAKDHDAENILINLLAKNYEDTYNSVVTEYSPEIAVSNLHRMAAYMIWHAELFPDNWNQFLEEMKEDEKGCDLFARFPEVFKAVFNTWKKVFYSLNEPHHKESKRACDIFMEAVDMMFKSAKFDPVRNQIARSLGICFADTWVNCEDDQIKDYFKANIPEFLKLHGHLCVVENIPEHLNPSRWIDK